MSTPAAKRRRIDIASHTLSKPFRSPFKTPLKSPLNAQNESQTDSIAPAPPMNSLSSAFTESTQLPHVSIPLTVSKKSVHISPRRPHKSPSPRSTASLNSDPDIAPLLRAQREFERQLREVKEQLETAEQARKIETESGKKDPAGEIDGDLLELITKWKIASRQAAEELFGQVRDRVNRFLLSLLPSDSVWLTGPSEWGGPRAWKEMHKRQQEFQNTWDQEEPANADPDDGDATEDAPKRDLYPEYDIDVETENEKSQHFTQSKDMGELPEQEDEFTMAMMLKTLNVDLTVIGYDKKQQRWTD